jgi:prepilin peptidase CpaA
MFANLLVSQAIIGMLVGLLVAVAIIDVRHLTISNRYCAAVVLLYPFYVLTAPYGVEWVDGAIVGAVALVIGFLMFAMRLAGGGDVKFFAAISLWAGRHWLVEYVFVTALAGGVIALGMLLHRRFMSTRTASSGDGHVAHALASANVFLGEMMMDPSSALASGPTPRSAASRLHRYDCQTQTGGSPTCGGSSIRRGDLHWRDRRGRDVAHERLKP